MVFVEKKKITESEGQRSRLGILPPGHVHTAEGWCAQHRRAVVQQGLESRASSTIRSVSIDEVVTATRKTTCGIDYLVPGFPDRAARSPYLGMIL